MEYAKKMALVEPRLLEKLQRPDGFESPVDQSMSRLDQEMRNILDRGELSEDEKVKHYQQTLSKYLTMKSQKQHEASKPIQVQLTTTPGAKTDNDHIEAEIVKTTPKTLKRRAQALIDRIKSSPILDWNEKGELVYNGESIPNTHIVDLVNDVIRKRRNFEPTGWQVFAQGLKEDHAPRDLIGHPERWHYMHPESSKQITPPKRRRPITSLSITGQPLTPSTRRRRVISTPIRRRWTPY